LRTNFVLWLLVRLLKQWTLFQDAAFTLLCPNLSTIEGLYSTYPKLQSGMHAIHCMYAVDCFRFLCWILDAKSFENKLNTNFVPERTKNIILSAHNLIKGIIRLWQCRKSALHTYTKQKRNTLLLCKSFLQFLTLAAKMMFDVCLTILLYLDYFQCVNDATANPLW